MAGLRDLDSGKIYIGPEEPKKLDRSVETKNGDKPYDGTLAVTGPAFVGGHSSDAKGVLNVGTDLGDFSPNVPGRAMDIEGDVNHEGNTTHKGDKDHDGNLINSNFRNCTGQNVSLSSSTINVQGWKGFDLKHPNIEGYRLRHVCVEGPEAAIYVRGKVSVDGIIELPDYWQNLVDKETITVQLTPIGCYQELFVERIDYGKTVRVKNSAGGAINAYYQVWANRVGEELIVEYEGTSAADYPGDNSQYSIQGYHYDVRGDEHQWNHGDGA
jgi:hypothetical protein